MLFPAPLANIDHAVPGRSLPPYPGAAVIEIACARGFDLPKRRAEPLENFFPVRPHLSGRPRETGRAKTRFSHGLESGDPVNFGHSIWCSSQTLMSVLTGSRLSRFALGRDDVALLFESKENRPLFAALGQGVALILFFRLPRNRGGRRATRRMTQVALDRSGSAWLPDGPGSPGPGREASRPAPCGAPTRHLGLYAFDRGRTGPAPSGRRGCPSTARGRRLRLSPLAGAAPGPRSQDAS
jgi:hypothetical protein